MADTDTDDLICLGVIAGAWGVQGAVRLKSFCSEPGAIADYAPLLTEDGRTSYRIRLIRPLKGAFAASLSGVNTREEAEALKGTRLCAPRDRLPELPDEEYYHTDLIGLTVFDSGGEMLGRVRAVQDHGAGDFLEVSCAGEPDLLLPFTRAVVPTVDLSSGRIIADPPASLGEKDDD